MIAFLIAGGAVVFLLACGVLAWWAVSEGRPMTFPGWDDGGDVVRSLSEEVISRSNRLNGGKA